MSEIVSVDITKLDAYKRFKSSLYEGERLEDMVNSVKNFGIMIPIIVRTVSKSDRYEILSGHNRVNAAKIAGKKNVPAIVKENLPDEFADIYFICTNLYQRSFRELKISEQAFMIALKYTQLFDSKKVKDITDELKAMSGSEKFGAPLGHEKKERIRDTTANEYGIGHTTVARLLRINKLSDELKIKVDDGEIKIRSAVEISYISKEMQKTLVKVMKEKNIIGIDMKKAKQLRDLFEMNEEPAEKAILSVLMGESEDSEPIKDRGKKITLPTELYKRYLYKYSAKEANEIIEKALEFYFKENADG